MADAQTNTFDFELVSPERKLMSEKAWQVTIPGEEGDMGVRAGHASLVSTIRPGVIEVKTSEEAERQRIFIAGGFADITASNCTILAEEAIPVTELNQEALEKEIAELEEGVYKIEDKLEKDRYARKLFLAKAKRMALNGTIAI